MRKIKFKKDKTVIQVSKLIGKNYSFSTKEGSKNK